IGNLPPKESCLLYMACIDPHLVSGADIIVDVDDSALAQLKKTDQTSHWSRRLLGLGKYSMHALLLTELGLIPLRFQRLILAVCYLCYLVSLPSGHYAHIALHDSHTLS
ncbi:hypothetical protein DFH08DRAFT_624335, partial [Mycena albidolilacea]